MRGRGEMEEPGRKFHGKKEGNTRQSWENGGRVLAENVSLLSLLVHSERIFILHSMILCLVKRMIQGKKCINTRIPYPSRVKLFVLKILLSLRTFTERCTEWFSSWIVEHHKLYPGKSLTIKENSFSLSVSHSYQEKRKQRKMVKKTSQRETATTVTMQNFRTQEE